MQHFKRLIVLIGIVFVSTLPTTTYSEQPQEMKVHFLNVGQGDSILIQTPQGKNMLIDGGTPESGKKVVTYLKKHQVDKIDLMIATHPDVDHIGGLPYVMKTIETDKIIDSGKLHTTKTYARYINQIRQQDIPLKIAKENEQIKLDPLLNIRVLNSYGKAKNNNQSSIALKISYEDIDFLLMSDIERKQEKDLLQKYNVEADIIKVAHHGSNTSSSLAFLKKVNPQVAILTYSKENNYGHPVNRVIKNLNKINAHIYSTAVFGNVVIRTEGKNYYVFPEKSPASGLLESTG